MPSKEEKERRKQIANLLAEQANEEFKNSLPMEVDVFKKLFDFLDVELEEKGCNNTLLLTEVFLQKNGIKNIAEVFAWLASQGGCCDCEVLANVEDSFDGL